MINTVPKLRTQSNQTADKLIFYVKLFTPWANWSWFIAEADFESGECFGYVHGFERELGYFNIHELMEIKGPFGLKIERDLHFDKCTFEKIK